jgi:hypothetical protein
MAARTMTIWGRFTAKMSSSRHTESVKARKVVEAASKDRGGPTPDFERVYGGFLDYKKGKDGGAASPSARKG